MAFAEHFCNKKFIFIGTPIQLYCSEWLDALKRLPLESDVLFVQQLHDRLGTVNQLRSALPKTCTLTEVPGSDHLYNDIEIVSAAIESWYKNY